jgi:hypothetical protein
MNTSELSVLVVNDPVDSGVISDGVVEWINKDNLVELEGGILSNPVGVEDSEVTDLSADSLLSDGSVVSPWLEGGNSLALWLTVDDTLGDWLLSATSSDSDSVDDVTLLSLVTESSSLIRSGWSGASVKHWQLSQLPCPESEHELHQSALLLSPQLLNVSVGTHVNSLAHEEDYFF